LLLLLLLVVMVLAMAMAGMLCAGLWRRRAGRGPAKHVALGHLQVVHQLVKVTIENILASLLLLLLLLLLLEQKSRLLLQLLQQPSINARL
jgi:hypothetical protein